MAECRVYIPSSDNYQIFLDNLKRLNPDWLKREEDLIKSFADCRGNTNKEIVEERVRKLNAYYGTRITNDELKEIEKLILQPGFDKELDGAEYVLVEKLRYVPSNRTKKGIIDLLSFASKYCHHCRPDKYPIYDSVNMTVMKVYVGYKDERNYLEYVKCFKAFCSFLGCDKLSGGEGFYVDKYIQAIGGHSELLLPERDKI